MPALRRSLSTAATLNLVEAFRTRAAVGTLMQGEAHAALDAGDTALAIARFRQALSSSPRYADAYIGLGEAYGHNRAYRPSLQAFQRYLEINPSGTQSRSTSTMAEPLVRTKRPSTKSGSLFASRHAANQSQSVTDA